MHSSSLKILKRWCGRISIVTIVHRYHFSEKMNTVTPIDNTEILMITAV
jgi:ribosomal protein S21